MKEIINLQLEGIIALKNLLEITFNKGLSNVEQTKEDLNSILNRLDYYYITNVKYLLFEVNYYLDIYQSTETEESLNNVVKAFSKMLKKIENYHQKLNENNTNISNILLHSNKELLESLSYKEYELINLNITLESNYSSLSLIEKSYYYVINLNKIVYEQSFIPNKALNNYKPKELHFGKLKGEVFIDNNLLYLKSINEVEKINDYSFIKGNNISESISNYKSKIISKIDATENMVLHVIRFNQIFEKQGKVFLQDENNILIEIVMYHLFNNDNQFKNLLSIIDSTNLKNNMLFCGLVYDKEFKLIPITIIEKNQLIRL